MAQKLLDIADVRPVLKQVRCEGVPERVHGDILENLSLMRRDFEKLLSAPDAQVPVGALSWEEMGGGLLNSDV
jgi:hypothetical protein